MSEIRYVELNSKTWSLIKKNDSPIYLVVRENNPFLQRKDWKGEEDYLSSNTHIKRIIISGPIKYTGHTGQSEPEAKKVLYDFCEVIAFNQSINHIQLQNWNDSRRCPIVPIITKNENLTHLVIRGCNMNWSDLASALLNYNKITLKNVAITYNTFDTVESGANMIASFVGHSIEKFIWMNNKTSNPALTTVPCGESLANVLKSSTCKIVDLNLQDSRLNDFQLNLLADGLREVNETLKALNLSLNQPRGDFLVQVQGITENCWMAFFTRLQTISFTLDELNLSRNEIGGV